MEVDDDIPQITAYHSSNRNITKSAESVETIDVTNYPVSEKKNRHSSVYDKNLCKDNQPLTEFINKCIFLDPTKGMETVINKVLLPVYVKADSEYKTSGKFRKVITKAFERLINDPDRKYTHISDVVETLKLHVSVPKSSPPPVKKRVNFITLSTKVSVGTHENSRKRPIIDSSTKISPKKSKPEVIALDCDDVDEVIPIDDEGIESNSYHNQVGEISQDNIDAKDNLVNDDDAIEIQDSQEVKIIDDTQNDGKEKQHSTNKSNDGTVFDEKYDNNELISDEDEKENLLSNENLSDDNQLLVPRKEKNVRLVKPKLKKKELEKKPEDMTEIEKAERIKTIEAKIEKCNKTIAKLDLEEVTDDSANSPYCKCDRLRATIVKLYKELCTLVEVEPPERHKITFHIKDGLPEGPIKRLEKFLNKKADADGETPFPDFSDVVRCVQKANEKDGIGWSKAKLMSEAQEIFTYCGRSLQKWRQQRAWRDLRGMAKPEEFEADPAEQDLELQARLEANRRLALQREAEVFSKFTRMESGPEPTASTSIQTEEPSENGDSSSDKKTEPNPTKALNGSNNNDEIHNPTEATVLSESNNNDEIQNTTKPTVLNKINNTDETQDPTEAAPLEENINDNIVDANSVVIKQEPEEMPINIQYRGDISLLIEISDSESEDEYGVLTF